MVRDLGLTTIVALHDLNLAAMFCDRIVVLRDGAVAACGAAAEALTEALLRDVCRVEAAVADGPHIRFRAA